VKCTLTPMAGDGTGVRGPQESVLIPNYSSALPSKHLFFEWSRGDSNPDRRRAKSELYRRRRAAHTIGHRPNRASYKHKRVSKTASRIGGYGGSGSRPCGESARRASPPGSPNRQERSLGHPRLIWRTCRPPSTRASGRGCSPGTARVTCKRYASRLREQTARADAVAALL
jgi:hypothetical protein